MPADKLCHGLLPKKQQLEQSTLMAVAKLWSVWKSSQKINADIPRDAGISSFVTVYRLLYTIVL